jgi:hypothetical protein
MAVGRYEGQSFAFELCLSLRSFRSLPCASSFPSLATVGAATTATRNSATHRHRHTNVFVIMILPFHAARMPTGPSNRDTARAVLAQMYLP